ncbi:uncharacterized protein PHALS_13014 [Plasmopara halstedii]|uniref:Uncharacterized protein n=1 Tax=Plasmopara halstedii TaxID=4781 RepID=A0A0P1ANP7_PLAHL|nr:uncharacterized protein PHALS_13014 [Plasmopara halstedii]CEG42764.1 hypothetical protein PHALS_13014 [Plasmopara halstedii]|eukprot:XP_024579133.1 hypothetical protein PHALS_13014 [Plasmopara halstedii]
MKLGPKARIVGLEVEGGNRQHDVSDHMDERPPKRDATKYKGKNQWVEAIQNVTDKSVCNITWDASEHCDIIRLKANIVAQGFT